MRAQIQFDPVYQAPARRVRPPKLLTRDRLSRSSRPPFPANEEREGTTKCGTSYKGTTSTTNVVLFVVLQACITAFDPNVTQA